MSGLRLDKLLQVHPTLTAASITRSHIQILIENGHIKVNGLISKPSYSVKFNDEISIVLPSAEPTDLKPYDFSLDIVFEDTDLIVVNKPAGLVVHPAAGHEQDTLVNALLNHTQQLSMKNEMRPGIVHRIDKETSGLLVIAKNDQAHEHLAQQFKNKTTHRLYYAVVEGNLKQPKGSVSSYLARHPTDRKRYASVKENGKIKTKFEPDFSTGKWAVTHYRLLELSQNKSLVELRLETGRTHQIRVHMSELGHVLTGDLLYGFSQKKLNELKINRFFLHASELGFIHPKTQEKLNFKTLWPNSDLETIRSWGFKFYDNLA